MQYGTRSTREPHVGERREMDGSAARSEAWRATRQRGERLDQTKEHRLSLRFGRFRATY
jgi:hypothetical protein